MFSDGLTFVREVARIEDPQFVPGKVAGHRARRLIDAPDAAFTDPFVLMAEDWSPPGLFGFHPHRGIETVTFVIEGTIKHRDSAGHKGIIHAGDAQWMTAGRGIQHEENPPVGTTAHTLQLWLNLPAACKMAAPRYQDLVASALPVRNEDGVEVRIFSGAHGDIVSTTLNHHPVTMLEVQVEIGGAFRYSFPATENAFVYVLEGTIEIGSAHSLLKTSQLGWLTRSEESGPSDLIIAAKGTAGRFLLFTGQPIREPIAFGGPFVMNTQEEIKQAFTDYRAGRF
ncbi:pirin family protein [Puniceibacterium sp. IMCC21224]|uniref:pirin family protein n=1 Tax=Puniceibacterium sp. IMCC21224 TaxID=1618204 RepID=UPI00065CEF74|nr:pirin family protein [Puniceibacterium sp. IMCC21224]KMK69057.1 Pirin-related protein [Puniceibacterium sp. IMCC21224]